MQLQYDSLMAGVCLRPRLEVQMMHQGFGGEFSYALELIAVLFSVNAVMEKVCSIAGSKNGIEIKKG